MRNPDALEVKRFRIQDIARLKHGVERDEDVGAGLASNLPKTAYQASKLELFGVTDNEKAVFVENSLMCVKVSDYPSNRIEELSAGDLSYNQCAQLRFAAGSGDND